MNRHLVLQAIILIGTLARVGISEIGSQNPIKLADAVNSAVIHRGGGDHE